MKGVHEQGLATPAAGSADGSATGDSSEPVGSGHTARATPYKGARARPLGHKGHWAQVGEGTFVVGMWLLYGVHRILGRLPFLLLLYPVVCYYWATRSAARHASMQYLQRMQAQHGVIGSPVKWHHSVRHFLAFADTILNKTLATTGRYRFDSVRFSGADLVHELIQRGQGGVFLTAHVGCIEMCQALATRCHGLKLNVLVHSGHAERFNRVLKRLDPHGAVHLIEVTDITPATAVLLAEKVARGEFVAVGADRVPVNASRITHAQFLGAPAPYPVGPYVLASLLKCPLMIMSCVRDRQGYVATIERLAEQVELPRKHREVKLAHYAALYAQTIEALMVRSPYEWFNFFPFWDQHQADPVQAMTPHE